MDQKVISRPPKQWDSQFRKSSSDFPSLDPANLKMSGFDEGQVVWSDQQLSDKTQNVQESSQFGISFLCSQQLSCSFSQITVPTACSLTCRSWMEWTALPNILAISLSPSFLPRPRLLLILAVPRTGQTSMRLVIQEANGRVEC